MPHFDFAAAARKIVILMTVDGTDDDLICIDGVEKYTFADADAGDLPRPTPLMTTLRMIQLVPSKYYHLLVQRRLRQDIRFSNHARDLRQMRTCRTSLVRLSFMPGTTRTSRDGAREGALAQPQRARCYACSHSQFFCAIQQVVDSCRQEEKTYSTLTCGA